MRTFLLLAALAVLGAVPPAAAQPAAADSSILRPGDVVRVTVWRQPELSGEFLIGPEGQVMHPLLRDARVAGVGMATVEARIREVLVRYGNEPRFVVEPLLRVGVGGQVVRPDVYTVPWGTSVTQALSRAGGAGERAALDRVELLSNGVRHVIDLSRPRPEAEQPRLRSGDTVMVPRRSEGIRGWIAPVTATISAIAGILVLLRQT